MSATSGGPGPTHPSETVHPADAAHGAAPGSPRVWQLSIEQVGPDWCLCTIADGERRVISRHGPSRRLAEAALAAMEATGDRGARIAGGSAPDARPAT